MTHTKNPLQLESASGMVEPLLDERECARLTERSVASLRRDRLSGKGIPYIKLISLVKYDMQDIRTYLEQNKRGAGGVWNE